MCQADELSLQREANGKMTGEFILRWIKRERKKAMCSVPRSSY